MAIFDVHAHAFPDAIAAGAIKTLLAEALWMPIQAYHDGTVRGLLDSMDRAGIDRCVVASVATRPSQVRKITDWSVSIRSPRIEPFASIHPDYERPEEEIERIASLGIRGLKFHPQYMNCHADDPRMIRISRAATRHNLAMTLHAGYDLGFERSELGSPASIRRLHEAVPDLRLLACHLGGWMRWEEVLTELAGLPIYLETSFCFGMCPEDLMLRILERHGAAYLVFGTDAPWADQKADRERFESLPIPGENLRQAMWENGIKYVEG